MEDKQNRIDYLQSEIERLKKYESAFKDLNTKYKFLKSRMNIVRVIADLKSW